MRSADLHGNTIRGARSPQAGLEALGGKHPIIGTPHGVRLHLGVEMVRDRESLGPAKEEPEAICERTFEPGMVIQPSGDHSNILKTKPPLCIDTDPPTSTSMRWTG